MRELVKVCYSRGLVCDYLFNKRNEVSKKREESFFKVFEVYIIFLLRFKNNYIFLVEF